MAAVTKEILPGVKEKFIKIMTSLNFILVNDQPADRWKLECVYKVSWNFGGKHAAFKVIRISSLIDEEERKLLIKIISGEVNKDC